MRLAEERASRFKREKEELKFANDKLSKEVEENRNLVISTRREFQDRIEELEKQLRESKYQANLSIFQDFFSLIGCFFYDVNLEFQE